MAIKAIQRTWYTAGSSAPLRCLPGLGHTTQACPFGVNYQNTYGLLELRHRSQPAPWTTTETTGLPGHLVDRLTYSA